VNERVRQVLRDSSWAYEGGREGGWVGGREGGREGGRVWGIDRAWEARCERYRVLVVCVRYRVFVVCVCARACVRACM